VSDMKNKVYRLDELCDIKSGKRIPKKMDFVTFETKHPYIRARDIKEGKINTDDLIYLEDDVFQKIKRYIINSGDIAITIVGASVGDTGYASKNVDGYNLTENAVRLTNYKNNVDSKFLHYVLAQKQYHDYMQLIAGAAAQPKLGIYKVKRIKVELPDLKKQEKIAYILSTNDNLIKNNNKRIKLLEQMAENLYKEWFVRFRFPGYEDVEFIDGFPKEWKICRIDQLSKIKAGGDAPDDSTKEITDECCIPIYSNGIENEGLYGYTSKAKINKTSITISARGTVGYTCLRRVSYTPIVRLICVIPHEEKLVNWLFYYFKRTIVIANGTSQQQITIPMMSREKVLLPTNDLIQKFYEYSTCYLDEIDSLKAQNSNLEKQRDMLLPRLMSGKLKV